jgi:hypothetical protein
MPFKVGIKITFFSLGSVVKDYNLLIFLLSYEEVDKLGLVARVQSKE